MNASQQLASTIAAGKAKQLAIPDIPYGGGRPVVEILKLPFMSLTLEEKAKLLQMQNELKGYRQSGKGKEVDCG